LILDALRIELKPRGVKVVTVKPGFVKTPMTEGNDFKMPFIVSAEKAAAVIVKGLKKEKTYIRFPFLMRVSSWVIRLMPNFLYEIFAAKFKSGAESQK
jgi:short-subunit dehydrogenase